jgi:acetyl-CoA carboxylase biotin carboxyl carrier protein
VSISNQPVATSTNISAGNENISEKLNLKSGTEITSPIIGTAYHAPEPGAKKFVEIGKKIKKGDTIMIVEAMKTMNHVPSTADGVVKEICVDDGHPVEFGQTIIILE